ncbi:hypothetical protein Lal_00041891 [Lupinus albus]|nr:hypothetical protein Lal_00041891 [Lupinus albus]
MKITALLVLKCNGGDDSDPVILANASDLNHFGYFQRSSVREFIVFVARTVAKRTPQSQRQSVQHEEYKVHAYNTNGLCAVGFMDDHYPIRSSFSLLTQVLEEYQKAFGESWRTVQADSTQPWPYLNEALTKFQACRYLLFIILASSRGEFVHIFDPAEADKLMKIQRELDETKIILHKTIDSVLARGEKLDSLVEKSSDLSAASQSFGSLINNSIFWVQPRVSPHPMDVLQTGQKNQSMLYHIVTFEEHHYPLCAWSNSVMSLIYGIAEGN